MRQRLWRCSYDALGRVMWHAFKHETVRQVINHPHLLNGGSWVAHRTIDLPTAVYSRPPDWFVEIPIWPK